MSSELRYLLDRTEISETIVRYFNSLDFKDWEAMRSTLAESVEVDFSELFGDPCATHDSDDFVEFASQVLGGFHATQHISPNHVIEIDGDEATARAGMYAWHVLSEEPRPDETFTLRGAYDIGMVRTGDGWRMNRLHMSVWQEIGNKGVYELARR